MIEKSDVKDMYFLSPMQEGMLFHYLMDKKSTVYFEQMAYCIDGEIQYKLFEQAFCSLIQRHDILRTIFVYQKVERPVQVVLKKRNASIYYQDISHSDDEKIKLIKDFKSQDKKRGFDLSKDLLIRLSIFKTAEKKYEIIWSFHHIILDGWSVGIICSDFLQIYHLLLKGEPVEMEPVKKYKEYITWLEKQDIDKGLEYWKNYLEGYHQPAFIPKSYNASSTGGYKCQNHRFLIDESTASNLMNLTRFHKVTLNTIFQVLWGILLKKYNNAADVVFGVIVSGRPIEIERIERMVGIFLNNIPIRIPLEDDDSFSQLVRRIQERELLSRSYEYVPLAQIQAHSYLKRSLIDHIMDFDIYPIQESLKNMNVNDIGFTIKELSIYEQTNYDFVIMISPREGIIVDIQYNSLVYDTSQVKQIASHYRELITRASENPQSSINQLKKISHQRKEEILTHFNEDLPKETVALLQEGEMLQGQLLENFSRYSNKSAVEYGNRTVTYAELEKKARAAARWIIHNGIEKETIIGILLEDRMELIALALGTLIAGCVMAPFYSAYPQKRIETMICSAGIQYIIIDEHNYRRFENSDFMKNNRIFIFYQDIYSSESRKTDQPEHLLYSPGDKMYIHFTSGSTGTPKAIIGKNSSLLHFIRWEIETFGITGESNRTAQFTIPGFDPFLRDIFVPLLSGGVICIPGNSDIVLHPAALRKWINQHRISLIHCVSSLFRQLSTETLTGEDFPVLQAIMLAGEKITPADVVKWYKTFGERIQLANCYGPTETTMSKICYFIRAADVNRERIPIGKPIKGSRVIILDEQMNICDTLEGGEIFIRTPYRSFGYHNDDELTREKFIRNPFISDPGDILYRSGDLARFLPDGNIDILGRVDRQVKIRGYRVELEEIEHALTSFPLVKEAAVIIQEISINNEMLCAFIAAANHRETGQEKLTEEINRYLGAKLPDYMVPAKIITVESLPRKATGKVDYEKLVEVFEKKSVDHSIPRGPIEEKLSLLWSEVLRIEKIGRHTRFFDLGGSSLNVMTLISRIHKAFDIRISLKDFFDNPTIEKQAGLIRGTLKKEIYNSIKKGEKKEFYRLSSAQERLYTLQQMEPAGTAYNLPAYFKLEGQLDKQRLEKSFRKLIHRHESLRTSFELIDGEPGQRINHEVDFQVQYHEPGGNTAAQEHNKNILKIQKSFIRAFDLSRAPLTRMELIKTRDMEYILMVDIHHIIADGISLGILVKDFMALYGGSELPLLRLQYREFSQWQKSKAHQELKKCQEEYWLKEFEGFEQLEPLNLWPDFQRPGLLSFAGSIVSFEIHKKQIEELKSITLQEGSTLFTALFVIYIIMLSKVSGQHDIVVGTLGAGRNHADLEHIIGMFVNTLAIRIAYDDQQTFRELLEIVSNKVLNAFENQDYPFNDLVKLVNTGRDQGRNPLFDAMFVLQDIGMEELKIPALKLSPREMVNPVSKFDITLHCQEVAGGNYHFSIEYRTTLFKEEKIERYARYFKQILGMVTKNQYKKLGEIDINHELSPIEFNTYNVNVEFNF